MSDADKLLGSLNVFVDERLMDDVIVSVVRSPQTPASTIEMLCTRCHGKIAAASVFGGNSELFSTYASMLVLARLHVERHEKSD